MSVGGDEKLAKKLVLGIGYEKCGTTTAHDVLATSPLICAPRRKETFFFNRNFEKGLDYYLSLFPDNESAPFLLDITPSYHMFETTYKHIKDMVQDYTILIFVRDPIRRAFSLYWHAITTHFALGVSNKNPDKVFATPFQRSFMDVTKRYNTYFLDLRKSIQSAISAFGAENITIVYFDEVEKGTFVEKIEKKLGCDLQVKRADTWSNKRAAVRYTITSESGKDLLVLKRGGAKPRSWPIEQIGWTAASNAIAATQYWSRVVTKSDYEKIYTRLYQGMDLEGVGLDRERLFQHGDLFYTM